MISQPTVNSSFKIVFISLTIGLITASCSSKLSVSLYRKQSNRFNTIQSQYKKLYEQKPFSVEFGDRRFSQISFEMITDTLRYIYKFDLNETNLVDTLDKYHYPAAAIASLIADMQIAQCTWINVLNYYSNREPNSIINLSVRAKKWDSWFKAEKYYTIAFFNEPQLFDKKERLIEYNEARQPMKINNAVYRKITDSICYAITDNFR